MNIRTAALGLVIAGLAVAGCNTASTVAGPPQAAFDERRGAAGHRTGAADCVGRS